MHLGDTTFSHSLRGATGGRHTLSGTTTPPQIRRGATGEVHILRGATTWVQILSGVTGKLQILAGATTTAHSVAGLHVPVKQFQHWASPEKTRSNPANAITSCRIHQLPNQKSSTQPLWKLWRILARFRLVRNALEVHAVTIQSCGAGFPKVSQN